MIKVIVSRPVAFVSSYDNKIHQFRDEYQKWIKENIGYDAPYEYSYTMLQERIYFEFWFIDEEDATAFKLRWL